MLLFGFEINLWQHAYLFIQGALWPAEGLQSFLAMLC